MTIDLWISLTMPARIDKMAYVLLPRLFGSAKKKNIRTMIIG